MFNTVFEFYKFLKRFMMGFLIIFLRCRIHRSLTKLAFIAFYTSFTHKTEQDVLGS